MRDFGRSPKRKFVKQERDSRRLLAIEKFDVVEKRQVCSCSMPSSSVVSSNARRRAVLELRSEPADRVLMDLVKAASNVAKHSVSSNRPPPS